MELEWDHQPIEGGGGGGTRLLGGEEELGMGRRGGEGWG